MEFVQLSDLEEGEILEYDSCSPVKSTDDFEMKNPPFRSLKVKTENYNFELNDAKESNFCLFQQESHGYMNKNLRNKLELNWKFSHSNMGAIDLESLSSDGEYKSEDNSKYPAEHKDYLCCNGQKRTKGKHSSHLYGTAEDIMSKIGETICRRSRCNFKKRKSKDFIKYSDNSYDVWRDQMFSGHLKEKIRKSKLRCSDSESEFSKCRIEKRKKRKKREVYFEEVAKPTKKGKMRDFDEMRRNLLEKLKQQKAEEIKAPAKAAAQEVENSEIQEVDMLIDCTNYVDDPLAPAQENSPNEVEQAQENDVEDELDLFKLRLIALASNKRRRNSGNQPRIEVPEDAAGGQRADDGSRGEMDLDRNELLLRAEALKTALLKKHQKRMNKLKHENPKAVASCSADVIPSSSTAQEGPSRKDTETENIRPSQDENRGEENVGSNDVPLNDISDSRNNQQEPLVSADATQKKGNIKAKCKRKKKKPCSLTNSLKENNEQNEALEEDDRILRSQLLSDLMRKKFLKDREVKPVRSSLSNVQMSANQIPVLPSHEPLKENGKQPPGVVKRNPLKKINVIKTAKTDLIPRIPKPEIQRIIVHLGSDDSSDESDVEENRTGGAQNESETKESVTVDSTSSKEKAKEVIQANYEKSVELLLSEARKKIEGKMQIAKNSSALTTTPEVIPAHRSALEQILHNYPKKNRKRPTRLLYAVYKHLPPSQRLEYLRLKQKIAERERLRKQPSEITKSAATQSLPANTAGQEVTQKPQTLSKPGNPLPINTPDGRDISFVNGGVSNPKLTGEFRNANGVLTKATAPRLVMNKMKNNLVGVHGKGLKKHLASPGVGFKASQTSSSLLLPSSQALISKLKLLLKKIKIEKVIEENYQKEISRLKSQLSAFERKKTEQRFKIKKLGEESMKTYRAIQGVTSRSNEREISKEGKCEEEKKVGKHEKAEEGKKVPYEPEKEAEKAGSKIDKQLKSDGDDKVSETVSGECSTAVDLLEYSSPLQVFHKVSDSSARVDPNVMMCQFDLMGVCKDEECTFQHLRAS